MKLSYTSRWSWALVLLVGFLGSCERETPYSENYDIPWPLPTISAIDPGTAEIGTEITLQGTNLDKTIRVLVGDNRRSADIVSKSEESVTISVPRTAASGPITLSTSYNKSTVSTDELEITYPETSVLEWPLVIYRGQNFKLKGENMDLVTEVALDGQKVMVEGASGTETEITVATEGLVLADNVTITVTSRGGVSNGVSPAIPVEDYDPNLKYDPAPAMTIWDFEDGVDPFTPSDITPQHGINLGGVPYGRGGKYLSIMEAAVPDPWGTEIGRVTLGAPVELTDFHEPHLTFLINTNGNAGYFQVEMEMNGVRGGGHFTGASSSNPDDNYMFQTQGWEWRSIDLANFPWEDWWSNGALEVSPTGTIEDLAFIFKQGNGTNPFEIHIDQIMITDGARKEGIKLWDFEDGANPYSGSANAGLNGASPLSGNNHLTVSLDNVTSWNWTGEMIFDAQSINLQEMDCPYLSIWINTNGKKGYFQVELFQNDTKWGIGQTAPDYVFETNGWELVHLPVSPDVLSNWGGDATEFDVKGALDYVKIGFSTGNADAVDYEISVDEIYLSDGPLF
ncbi:IPT/TIG domain-containing protein [Pontibacter sp. G13]|uniref:IPT/TIG domain-containing protein n=1 Tax=Pontibacter sp. G13 TaxID=3074898 RepID=UPI00288BA1DF|nr:IPT/TIG domain-containing protein [Pontibacter sp. G13]WNJ21067.1 IPT/TIG domain-containing protein [Pontibacter sp. G13]